MRHQAWISKTVHGPDLTLDAIRELRELRKFEASYKKPEDFPTINAKDCWPEAMEAIDKYLRSVLGERKIPLAYVEVPDDADLVYPTIQDQMIARAPHYVVNAAGVRTLDPTYIVNC